MTKLKKINVWSLAKFQALLLALAGFLLGIIYSLGGLIYDVFTTGSVNYGTALAFLALIGMPLIAAIAGYILGIIEAILFNIFSAWFGGTETNFGG